MARYAISRERTLRGLGRTFYFVPRRRWLRGMGDSTDIDFATGLPCDDPRANCNPVVEPSSYSPTTTTLAPPPGFFTSPGPIIPAQKNLPVAPPDITAIPIAPTIVFPSQGTVRPPVAPPPASWLDQQMVAGFPNKYLALAALGAGFLLSLSSARRRR